MSRPEPKPTQIDRVDALQYELHRAEYMKAQADLRSAQLELARAQRALDDAAAAGKAFEADLQKRYEIGPDDRFNYKTGEIIRKAPSPAPSSPSSKPSADITPPSSPSASSPSSKATAKPNGKAKAKAKSKKEGAPNVA